jgi:hypothetical protein
MQRMEKYWKWKFKDGTFFYRKTYDTQGAIDYMEMQYAFYKKDSYPVGVIEDWDYNNVQKVN